MGIYGDLCWFYADLWDLWGFHMEMYLWILDDLRWRCMYNVCLYWITTWDFLLKIWCCFQTLQLMSRIYHPNLGRNGSTQNATAYGTGLNKQWPRHNSKTQQQDTTTRHNKNIRVFTCFHHDRGANRIPCTSLKTKNLGEATWSGRCRHRNFRWPGHKMYSFLLYANMGVSENGVYP